MAKPFLPNLEPLIEAGINPKTGLPNKIATRPCIKDDIKRILRIVDEQDAVHKGTWYNLPCNITSEELERMLYYKGQLCFFYLKDLDQFFFMPYALDGTLDFYGRYNRIHPVPMTSGEDKAAKAQATYLADVKLNCVYGLKDPLELKESDLYDSAVLLHDYTKQQSQTVIPRQQLNDCLLDVMAECIPLMRTSLLNNTGVSGVRVQDADQAESVKDGVNAIVNAALDGESMVPIVGTMEFQELTGAAGSSNPDQFMLAMQSLDNFRLQTHGLKNGGLFKKSQYQNNADVQMNMGEVDNPLQDAVAIRQNFCNIVNSIWNLGIWYEPAEQESMLDQDGDGKLYKDDQMGENSGVESNTEGADENV